MFRHWENAMQLFSSLPFRYYVTTRQVCSGASTYQVAGDWGNTSSGRDEHFEAGFVLLVLTVWYLRRICGKWTSKERVLISRESTGWHEEEKKRLKLAKTICGWRPGGKIFPFPRRASEPILNLLESWRTFLSKSRSNPSWQRIPARLWRRYVTMHCLHT